MKKRKETELDFEIDELTNSITNALTGEVFETKIIRLVNKDSHQIKKANWVFDWHKELKDHAKGIYKLTTEHNPFVIHGLICLSDENDHVFMHLIENAKFNKGANKFYKGVAANMVAFGCKLSFEKGYDGVVAFVAKSHLVEHYKLTLGAKQVSTNRMFIDTKEAIVLIQLYFKDFKP